MPSPPGKGEKVAEGRIRGLFAESDAIKFLTALGEVYKKQRSAAGLRFIVGPQLHGQKDVGQKNGCYFSAHTFFCPERPRF